MGAGFNDKLAVTVADPLPTGSNTIGKVNLATAIPGGTNVIGKVGIDQTTPGTTNGVYVTNQITSLVYTQAMNTGFWNNTPVSAGGVSPSAYLPGRVRVLINVSAATEITIQFSADNSAWYDGDVVNFTSAGTKTIVVDCSYYMRLRSSQAATITAGYICLAG